MVAEFRDSEGNRMVIGSRDSGDPSPPNGGALPGPRMEAA